MLSSLFLAISSSIDALGIGITYGIKNTKISFSVKFVLFILLFIAGTIAILIGDAIQDVFSTNFANLLSNFILIGIGVYICFKSAKKDNKKANIFNDPISSDLNNSKSIDTKEAVLLAVALALDSFCLGICGAISDVDLKLFPFFVSLFHVLFLQFGICFGTKINKICKLPKNIWTLISGILLICIGIFEFL